MRSPRPPTSQVDEMWGGYERGDTYRARLVARSILLGPGTDAEREAAQAFLARTGVPRPAIYVAACAAALVLSMVCLAIVRG